MKSINLNMTSVEVKAETRSIKATWNRELAADISSFTNIDTDFLESVLTKELRRETRKKSINKIFKN